MWQELKTNTALHQRAICTAVHCIAGNLVIISFQVHGPKGPRPLYYMIPYHTRVYGLMHTLSVKIIQVKRVWKQFLLTFLLNIRTMFMLWRILNCPRTTLNTWKTWWSAALIEIESKPLYLNFLIIPPRTKLWSVYCTIHQVRTRNWAPSVLLVDTVDNFPVNITSATDDIPHMNLMYESYSISILCQSNCTF